MRISFVTYCVCLAGYFDVWSTVKGGGISSQARAVRLGLARALNAADPSNRAKFKPCTHHYYIVAFCVYLHVHVYQHIRINIYVYFFRYTHLYTYTPYHVHTDDLMTRDARRVERKKPGQKKARKNFQWVKR